jgi:hypothetical protein
MPYPSAPSTLARIIRRLEEVLGMGSRRRLSLEGLTLHRRQHDDDDLERSRLDRQEVQRRIRAGREELADIAYQSIQAESAAEDY